MTKTIVPFIIVGGLIISNVASAQLFGPPKYQIVQSDDRFSANPTLSISGKYNLFTNRQSGYVSVMGDAFFIDPVVITKPGAKTVTLHILNDCTSHGQGQKWVCVGTPQELAFITGEGTPIVLKITQPDVKVGEASTNTVTHDVSVSIAETGFADLSVEDYQRIMNATQLAAKLSGSDKDITFENKVIAKGFQANLKSFYEQYMK